MTGLETAALVALVRRGDRPGHEYAELVEAHGSALALLPKDAARELDTIAAAVRRWERRGISIATVLDESYPANLRTVYDRPPVVFVRGRLTRDDERSVAVIGIRSPSERGLALGREIAVDLVDAGYTIVGGLAAGVETAIQDATLERGGRWVAVVGSGVAPASSALNAALGRAAAVVSPFWPDAPPSSSVLLASMRSGIACAALLAEASGSSGRLHARLALEHGRPVFVPVALLEHPWARRFAKRPGTHIVRSADEVVERLDGIVAPTVLTA